MFVCIVNFEADVVGKQPKAIKTRKSLEVTVNNDSGGKQRKVLIQNKTLANRYLMRNIYVHRHINHM